MAAEELNDSLYWAALRGDVERVRKCISDGANVSYQDEYGQTPLLGASCNGHTDVVRILLENKADPKISDKDGDTPLYRASSNGHTDVVRILLENKADPNISDKDGDTPLYRASHKGHTDVVRILLENKADLNISTYYGWTPLYGASLNGHTDVVRILLENKADPNISDTDGKTPLFGASHKGHTDVVRILLENKVDPNISKKMGHTPLSVADNADICELLIAHGATVEAVDNGKITDSSNGTVTTTDPSNTTIEGAAVTPSPSHSIPPADKGPATIEVNIEKISKVVTGAKGKMKVTCFLLHGAPCAGKTSAKRLLLGLAPLDRGNSTKLLEDVVKAIRNIGTIKVMAVNESCLELEVMDGKKTIQMIQREIQKFLDAENKEASQEKSKRNKTKSSPASSRHTTNNTVHDHCLATPTPGPSHSSPDEGKSSPPPITESANPSRSEVLRDIATNLDSLESSTDGPTLFQCHHINIVDSGGQSQFSNLLPLVFLSQMQHHLVTIRLDQLLSDKPKNCYSRDGTIHQLPERLVLTNYQLIERVCQLAAGSQSRVIIIATRLDDQNTEEPLAKKNELLKPLVLKYADNIVLNEQGDPIFAVNAMAPVGEERKGYTRMLQEVILDAPVLSTNMTDQVVKKDGIDVPLRWIVLEHELNRQSEDVGVFEKTKTESIADDLQVKDLTEALDFFKELALLYHYPVLLDKVFTSITPISQRLSEVVEATLVHKGGLRTNEHKKLQRTGKLSISFLKMLCRKLPPNEFFSLDDFVRLMIDLRVFFPIDPDTIFIPSLLPVEITKPLGKELHEPLLCYWMHNDDEVRILPQSYFHALIVELLGRKETIKLNTMCNDHSRSTIHLIAILASCKKYRLVVVDCDFWFEVFVDSRLECKQHQLILDLIQSCTARVLDQLKLSRLGELQYGLRCYSPECSVEGGHPSECVDRCPFSFKCLKSGEFWVEEESGRHFWFRGVQSLTGTLLSNSRKRTLEDTDDEHSLPQKRKEICTEDDTDSVSAVVNKYPMPSSSRKRTLEDTDDKHPVPQKRKEICTEDDTDSVSAVVNKYPMPKLNEVFDLLKEKSPYWFDIGREFKVSLDVRESLSHRVHSTSDRSCLEKVLNEWLSTTDQSLVTWEEFIRVLTDGLKYMKIVDQTKTFLQNL